MSEPLLDLAKEVLEQKHPISFSDLWKEVGDLAELDLASRKNKISRFYTSLTMDGRFVNLGENVWDLKTRHTFEETHAKDMSLYSEDDDDADDDDEDDVSYQNKPRKEESEDSDDSDSEQGEDK